MTLELRVGDARAFFETPFSCYRPEDGYVSPMRSDVMRMLDPGANPLWKAGNPFRFWTAHRAGRPVGRIVAHVHGQSNTRHRTRRAQFGFFDCSNDAEAAKALLDAAGNFARESGQSELVGNFNLTAMQQAGVMTEGFGRKGFTDMMTNAPHIPRLLEANGFVPFFPMTTYEIDLTSVPPFESPNLLETDGFRFAPIEKRVFPERMAEARIVLNDGFDQNPMFVPLTAEEFEFQAGEMTSILDPRLSSVLMHRDRPIGTVICIPDLNGFLSATRSRIGIMTPFHYLRFRLRRKRAVVIFYSVVRDWHGKGIMPAILKRTIGALKDAGYEKLGVTWIADENPASLRQMQRLNARPLHRLHLFRKAMA